MAYSEASSNYQQPQQQQRMSMPRDDKCDVCDVCDGCFRRECDKAWHKCITKIRKLVYEQKGAVRCRVYRRWFISKGSIAVHRCGRQHQETDSQDDNTLITSYSMVVTAPMVVSRNTICKCVYVSK